MKQILIQLNHQRQELSKHFNHFRGQIYHFLGIACFFQWEITVVMGKKHRDKFSVETQPEQVLSGAQATEFYGSLFSTDTDTDTDTLATSL
jgi:hypothetical protein